MGQSTGQILVRTPNYLGDHVLALDFYQGLREAYPDKKITFLCRQNLESFPDESYRDGKIILVGPFLENVRRLRVTQFDLGISLPHSISSAACLALSGIRHRVGYAEFGAELFLNSSLRWPERTAGKHKRTLYLELLEFITGQKYRESPQNLPMKNVSGPIVIAPGASIELREWPYYLELMIELKSRWPKIEFVIVGTDEKWRSLASVMPEGVRDNIGRTSLAELIAICRSARLVIANDSGVAHLAATVSRVPTLVIFGPGDPEYIQPLGPEVARVRRDDLPCSPCEKPYCRAPYGEKACLTGLSVERVLKAAAEFL